MSQQNTKIECSKTCLKACSKRRFQLPAAAVLISVLFTCSIAGVKANSTDEWDQYGGPGGQQYSHLSQIDADNVNRLQRAWEFRTGDLNQGFKRKAYSFQTQPIFWNQTLYISTSANWVFAVDAKSGAELWRFDPKLPKDIGYAESASRGVSIWHGESLQCPDRVFLGTLLGEVYALDAKSGKPCLDFGDKGRVDMSVGAKNGEEDLRPGEYSITSPPAVLGNQLIVGSAIGDNRGIKLERGIVRALDVRSGATKWLWDPVPRSASEVNYESWENDSGLVTGAANVWPPITVDASRNLVFVSSGSPSPDFYGGERLGDNHYANSLVALDGKTGKVVWHEQLVHHDIWDYDIPSQPTLTDITIKGHLIPAVAVVTKTGMLYAFNRDSGEPLYEIIEKPVPDTDVPGERVSPTQPFSSLPALADQKALGVEDAFGIAWFDKRACKKVLENMRSEGIFTPPSLRGTVMNPSYAGGSNWGGVAIDPRRQIAITNVNQIPALVRLIPRDKLDDLRETGDLEGWDISRQAGTPYFMARRVFLSPIGLPCTKPPWGKLVALDLREGKILWDIPLGSIRDLAPALVPNFKWGVPGLGGPLITKSGLIFIGAVTEHVFRAFDTETGKELWHERLPAAAIATPMTYEIEGEQYIAIAVGGHDMLGLKRGDYLISFKLPSE